jgi:methyl-CpG-binding domain protein 4
MDSPATEPWISTTPPASRFADHEEPLPIIPTDELGMIADDEAENGASRSTNAPTKRKRPKKYVRENNRKCLSQHFIAKGSAITTSPTTPQKPVIIAGLNLNELSSESSLTDVPSDIGSDPFDSEVEKFSTLKPAKIKRPTKSPYFPNKPRPNFLSCLPFPPLSAQKFGLMQERLAHDPFRLLIATIFLNRTRGEQAMPVFFQLMQRYPTVADLAGANIEHVVEIIHRLGFQNQRARKCIELAKTWLKDPPEKEKRYRKLNYPVKGDGRDISADGVIADNDKRVAWEISYLPGLGPYSHDSWRIFCRDHLRGLSESWNGEGAVKEFEPEWKRVLPTDKELRAYLTWMWMKEGWVWNKETGQRTKAEEELLRRARGGGIVQEQQENDHLVLTSKSEMDECASGMERPAGSFLPGHNVGKIDFGDGQLEEVH